MYGRSEGVTRSTYEKWRIPTPSAASTVNGDVARSDRATGAAIGLVNGLLIVGLRIPDLLATLGMMFLLAGLQLIPSAGLSITTGLILSDGSVAQGAFDPAFLAIGRYRLWDVAPLPVVIVAVIAIVAWFFMERTRWGRVFYAVGGNETAAYLAGAPVQRYRVAAYVISGARPRSAASSSPRGSGAAMSLPARRCCSTASRHP